MGNTKLSKKRQITKGTYGKPTEQLFPKDGHSVNLTKHDIFTQYVKTAQKLTSITLITDRREHHNTSSALARVCNLYRICSDLRLNVYEATITVDQIMIVFCFNFFCHMTLLLFSG